MEANNIGMSSWNDDMPMCFPLPALMKPGAVVRSTGVPNSSCRSRQVTLLQDSLWPGKSMASLERKHQIKHHQTKFAVFCDTRYVAEVAECIAPNISPTEYRNVTWINYNFPGIWKYQELPITGKKPDRMWLSNEMCCRPSQNTTFFFPNKIRAETALARLERCQEPGLTSHGYVWKCCVPLNPMVLLIIIPIKWLFHWEYTLFSDKPTCLHMSQHGKRWNSHCFWILCGFSPGFSPVFSTASWKIVRYAASFIPLIHYLSMPSQISRPYARPLENDKRACQFSIQPSYIIIDQWTLTDLTPPFCWPNIWSHLP